MPERAKTWKTNGRKDKRIKTKVVNTENSLLKAQQSSNSWPRHSHITAEHPATHSPFAIPALNSSCTSLAHAIASSFPPKLTNALC